VQEAQKNAVFFPSPTVEQFHLLHPSLLRSQMQQGLGGQEYFSLQSNLQGGEGMFAGPTFAPIIPLPSCSMKTAILQPVSPNSKLSAIRIGGPSAVEIEGTARMVASTAANRNLYVLLSIFPPPITMELGSVRSVTERGTIN
jgi:hypothetical protein